MPSLTVKALEWREKKHAKEMKTLRNASGKVNDNSKLVSFLYDLMRDHLPAADVQKLMMEAQDVPVEFTNGYLAKYAKYIARRLR